MTLDARTVLVCKLDAVVVAMVEAAVAMRQFAPNNIDMHRRAKELDAAAQATHQAVQKIKGAEHA